LFYFSLERNSPEIENIENVTVSRYNFDFQNTVCMHMSKYTMNNKKLSSTYVPRMKRSAFPDGKMKGIEKMDNFLRIVRSVSGRVRNKAWVS